MERIGGFREGFDGSQDYDLVLRVTEQARRVVHIPEVLYHWRAVPGSAAADSTAKPYAYIAAMKAVTESLHRRHIAATVGPIDGLPGNYRVTRRLDPDVPVSIIVPTRGSSGFVWGEKRVFVVEALRSALARTAHPIIEVVVVYDEETPDSVLAQLRQICGGRLVLVPYEGPFNFAEKINLGMLASNGSRLVLLNDDVEVISDGWLEQLVAPLDEPDVGMTGAKMYFADRTIQHAGLATQYGRHMHPYRGTSGSSPGPMCDLVVSREASGVTAACAGIRRDVFDAVGGMSELLPMNFNDVDLCNKVRHLGYRIVWLANCELYHFESRTRESTVHSWEEEFVAARWGEPGRDEYLPQDGR
jgi:GT2 family glycosyltransferase